MSNTFSIGGENFSWGLRSLVTGLAGSREYFCVFINLLSPRVCPIWTGHDLPAD